MRILFLGDVMGRAGRRAVKMRLPFLKEKLAPDVVVVNGENAAGGHGITLKLARELLQAGVDCLTMGNHSWNQKTLENDIVDEPRLVRPLNSPADTPGEGFYLHTLADGRKILILNLQANLYMKVPLADPFATMTAFLETHALGRDAQAIFIDFHGEATSEKMAMAHFLDGRVSAVIGTHTHIPTADEHILAGGTAFQADAGMCGDFDSVIGMDKKNVLTRFLSGGRGPRLEPALGEATICGTFIETDDITGLARSIEPVRLGGCLRATFSGETTRTE